MTDETMINGVALGDEVPADLESVGEDICPACHGSGHAEDGTCPACEGTGLVGSAVGGG